MRQTLFLADKFLAPSRTIRLSVRFHLQCTPILCQGARTSPNDEHAGDKASEYSPMADDQLKENGLQKVSNLYSPMSRFHSGYCNISDPPYLDPQALRERLPSAPKNSARIHSPFSLLSVLSQNVYPIYSQTPPPRNRGLDEGFVRG